MNLSEVLADELAQAGPKRTRSGAPKGFEPGVRYDGGIPVEVTTDAVNHLSTEDDWRDAVAAMGISLPDGVAPGPRRGPLRPGSVDPPRGVHAGRGPRPAPPGTLGISP